MVVENVLYVLFSKRCCVSLHLFLHNTVEQVLCRRCSTQHLLHNTFYTTPWNKCDTLQHTATHCNTLQHTATHCNTLQHTATPWNKCCVCVCVIVCVCECVTCILCVCVHVSACMWNRPSKRPPFVLQRVAVCCSVSQRVAVYCSVSQCVAACRSVSQCAAVCCSVSQCVAVCCNVLQCAAVCCVGECILFVCDIALSVRV